MNPDKERLLAFMRSGEECGICEGYVEDYETGEDVKTIVDCDYERDGLLWSATDLYNFEHYDLELNPEFCAAALEIS